MFLVETIAVTAHDKNAGNGQLQRARTQEQNDNVVFIVEKGIGRTVVENGKIQGNAR